jgi:hypothetical protein
MNKKDRIIHDQNGLIMLHQQMIDLYKDQIATLESYSPMDIQAMFESAALKLLVKNAEEFTTAMIERRELYKQELSDEE